jgi:hypothetical protein
MDLRGLTWVKRTRVHTWEIVINGQFCKVILASSWFLDLFEKQELFLN